MIETSDHPPVRVAIVGWGRWGRLCHGLLASTTPGMTLRGVVSRSPDKRADAERQHGCPTYATLDDALAGDAELFVLATPNDRHAVDAIACLEAGRHVLVDKPIATTVAQADAMLKAAATAGRVLSVFQNRRLDGDFLTVRRLVADGRLGDLRWAELAWQSFGPTRGWRGDADRGGGRLVDLGSHLIDQLLVLMPGRIESVYARIVREFEDADVESDALVLIRFADGRTGVIDCSSRAALPKPRFYLRGTTATFEKFGIDPQEGELSNGIDAVQAVREPREQWGRLRSASDGKLSGRPEDAERVETLPGDWPDFYANLRDSIRGGAELLVKPRESRRVLAVLEAAFRSEASGQAEAVDGE